MEYRIETINEKRLVGKQLGMSVMNDQTGALWQSFIPLMGEIKHRVGDGFYSMQIYEHVFDLRTFDPNQAFIKWAAVEVSDYDTISEGTETYILKGGSYAVFNHVGPASTFIKSLQYIHGTWLPSSDYRVDQREHFELLPAGYNPMDEDAREEIWVPIIHK